MIQVTCPNPTCGKLSAVQDEFAGKQAKCPACGAIMAIPSAVGSPAAESSRATSSSLPESPAAETSKRPGRKFMAWTALFTHVKTIAIANFVLGGLSLLAGLWTSLVPGELAAARRTIATKGMSAERAEKIAREFARAEGAATPWMVTFFLVLGILMALWGAAAIAGGIGLSNRRNWGQVLALVLAGFAGALGLAALVPPFGGSLAFLAAVIAYLGYAAWLFLAMTRPVRPNDVAQP